MSITRRNLLKMLGAAGLSIPGSERFFPLLEAYAERPHAADVRGPGIESFSRSVCRDCANHCSLALRMIDDIPVGLRGTSWHPGSQGALCVSGQSQMQALFDPDRLALPLRRRDAGEAGSPVSWPEGMALLQEKLRPLIEQGRGDKLIVIDGRTPSLGTLLVESWTAAIPGARYVPFRVETAMDRMIGEFLGGGQGGRPRLDLGASGAILLVGYELLDVDGSPVSQMREHAERREDPRLGNNPTIYMGPRQSPTAVKADLWIPCRPGKEREILLGLAESISREHPRRESLMNEYSRWIPEAEDPVEFARHFSLENVAQRQGIKLDELLAARRALIRNSPAVTLAGPSLLRRASGASDYRAALALNLWTEGLREKGGLSWVEDPLKTLGREMGLASTANADAGHLADTLEPLFEIKRSPVEVMICIEANLAHELPGQDQVSRALTHIPFLVNIGAYEDETSELAHLTLPTLFDLESWDLPASAWGQSRSTIQVQRPAIEPIVEARSTTDLWLELATAGIAGADFAAPAASSRALVESAIDHLTARGDGRFIDAAGEKELREVDRGRARRALLAGEAAWLGEPKTVATTNTPPTKRFETPVATRDLAPGQLWLQPFDGPAILGGRVLNRPMLMELSGYWQGLAWETWIELHPADAERNGLVNGDRVRIRGPRAEIEAKAVVTHAVAEGVVAVPVGFGHRALGDVARGLGASVLALPNAIFDRETGTPAWGPMPVFLTRA